MEGSKEQPRGKWVGRYWIMAGGDTLHAGMDITTAIPDGLDESSAQRAEQDAREAAGIRLYRDGQFSLGQLAKFLGVERDRLDEVLERHAVGILNGVSAKEIAEEADTLRGRREDRPGTFPKS
jgi:predicted HTH domain antitoxin